MEFKILGHRITISKISSERKKFNTGERRSGRTTRLTDLHIQNLFENGKIRVFDHYPSRNADDMVFKRIIERILKENLLKKDDFEIDRSRLTITLKKNREAEN